MSVRSAEPVAPPPGPILAVEDDPITRRLLEKTLGDAGHTVQVVDSAAGAAEAIASAAPSLIILDLVLPDADGRNLLGSWRSAPATATVPVIVLTVTATPEIRNQCLALGASEFLEKPFDVRVLIETVARLLAAGEATVEVGADPLTGVASRAALCDAYRGAVASLPTSGVMSVVLIDVDRFRAVNETCGTVTADSVLRGVADLVRTSTASEQVVGRWQGDQFMALLPGVAEQAATDWLERLLEALRQHAFTSEQGGLFYVTFSGGVAEVSAETPMDDAVSAALGCLYLAKEAGRAQVVNSATEVERPESTVLLADDDPIVAAVVKSSLEGQGLVVEHYVNGALALEAAQHKRVGLFLLDVNMPEMDGFELLARLRALPEYAKVPIAMLTSLGDEDSLGRALALGADDYLVKPVSSPELAAHVHRLLSRWVEGRLHELQGSGLYIRGIELLHQVFEAVVADQPIPVKDLSLLTLCIVGDLKVQPAKLLGQVMNPTVLYDDFLAQHSLNSAILATIVGQEVGFEGDDLDWLCLAALLHEVGCVRLPKGLLSKSGDLTDEERALIRRRPEFSHEIISKLAPEYAEAANIAMQVHERPDGSGYPKGLAGDEISLEAQILGAVEVFEALTHHRPYRESPQAASEAVKYLLDSRHTQFLDRVLKALISKVGLYPVGSYVLLGTDEVALVLEHREQNPMRPLLAVVTDRAGKPLDSPRITDPMLNPQIHIKSSVTPPEVGGVVC